MHCHPLLHLMKHKTVQILNNDIWIQGRFLEKQRKHIAILCSAQPSVFTGTVVTFNHKAIIREPDRTVCQALPNQIRLVQILKSCQILVKVISFANKPEILKHNYVSERKEKHVEETLKLQQQGKAE